MKLTELINKHYQDLSETEKGIYHYIANHPEKVAEMNILEFARESLSSKSSVIRFCQKLGFTGYSEMRNFVKWNEEVMEKNTDYSFASQVKQDSERLLESLDERKWTQIYDELDQARNIFIVVTGETQRNQALEFQRLLILSGKNSGILFGNQHTAEFRQISSTLQSNDFVIILSLSGENADLESVVQQMKIRKAKLLSITNYSNNWLSKNCDYNLYARSSKSPETRDWWLKTTSTFFVLIETFMFGFNDYLRKRSDR